jgi:hypothetical protein
MIHAEMAKIAIWSTSTLGHVQWRCLWMGARIFFQIDRQLYPMIPVHRRLITGVDARRCARRFTFAARNRIENVRELSAGNKEASVGAFASWVGRQE